MLPPTRESAPPPTPLENHPLFLGIRPQLRRPVSRRVCYSAEHSFCYFRIPKAANSTIVLTLTAHAGIALPEEDPAKPEARVRTAKRAFSRVPALEEVDRAFTFTFVRNPLTRALSAYRDKAARRDYVKTYGLRHRFFPGRKFTFLDFLRRLEDGALMADPHWAPQSELIPYDPDRLDKIGKVESIDEDLRAVIEAIFQCPMEMRIRRHRRTGADRVAENCIGAEERAILQRLYARDLERFYPEV